MNKIKKIGKSLLCIALEWQVKRLRNKHNFRLVVVVGSVGKTSTKMAIARILSSQKTVRYQEGNYNDRLTVPLVIFGHDNPSVFNIIAWAKIFTDNERQIKDKFIADIVVAELGTDGPGQIEEFRYLQPDIAVVTAVTPEHMEFFDSLDAVAKEELTVADYSERVIINTDDVNERFLHLGGVKHCISTSLKHKADYRGNLNGQNLNIKSENLDITAKINLLGRQGASTALLAVAVADQLGYHSAKIKSTLATLRPFNGRMNPLSGIKSSLIIDDTYNSSPSAVIAALDVVYAMKASQKIAILGTMNELGEFSEEAHRQIGKYCDPKQLDLVVTIGDPARKYTAIEAGLKGCKVRSFDSPYDAGNYVKKNLGDKALVLAKGSQNRVFAEESLKVLLAKPSDKKHLVRQSDYWLSVKSSQFAEDK